LLLGNELSFVVDGLNEVLFIGGWHGRVIEGLKYCH
jgi:hypothetical protein